MSFGSLITVSVSLWLNMPSCTMHVTRGGGARLGGWLGPRMFWIHWHVVPPLATSCGGGGAADTVAVATIVRTVHSQHLLCQH